MSKTRFIAIDIETSGLYPHIGKSKIFCIAVNTGKSIQVYEDINKVRPILEDRSWCKVIHNASFDCFWLKRLHGITVRNIWDTRLMEIVLIGETMRGAKDEETKNELSTSLEYTLKRYGLAELDKHIGKSFSTKNINSRLAADEIEYVKNDVRYLLSLQAMQERRLTLLDLMRVADLENKTVEKVVEMRDRGIGFSEKIWLDIAKENELIYNSMMKKLPSSVQNWNSPAQVKKYFNSRGIPIQSLTGIEEIAEQYNDPSLNSFIEMRSMYKAATAYGAGWLTDDIKGNTVDPDGRVRADFEQIINTGRFSCSHPNLQQLPKNGKHRSAFVPAKGNVFVIGDFSSQEIGIMAAASNEEIWIKAMLRKEDVHSLTASLLYPDIWLSGKEKGCTFPKKCKCSEHVRVREYAKVINFAIAYGAGPESIGKRLKLANKEATRLLNRYKKVVPRLTKWLSRNSENSIKTRMSYSADPFKRRRVLRDPEDWMLRNIGKNNPVQSCGANMIKLSMISLSDNCPIVLTIHDEIILEVPKKNALKAQKELKSIMEKAADYCTGVPGLIQVEPRIANNLQKEQ